MPSETTIKDVIVEGQPWGTAAHHLRPDHKEFYNAVMSLADRIAEEILLNGGTKEHNFGPSGTPARDSEKAWEVFRTAGRHVVQIFSVNNKIPPTEMINPPMIVREADENAQSRLTELLMHSARASALFYEKTTPALSQILAENFIRIPPLNESSVMFETKQMLNHDLLEQFMRHAEAQKSDILKKENAGRDGLAVILDQIRRDAGQEGKKIIAIWEKSYVPQMMGRNVLVFGKTALFLAAVKLDNSCNVPDNFRKPVSRLFERTAQASAFAFSPGV